MNDLEKWRALANFRPSIERSPWEGNMCAYLADAANRVETLERENADARRHIAQLVETLDARTVAKIRLEDENAAMAKVVEAARRLVTATNPLIHNDPYRERQAVIDALAALAPATSKETP